MPGQPTASAVPFARLGSFFSYESLDRFRELLRVLSMALPKGYEFQMAGAEKQTSQRILFAIGAPTIAQKGTAVTRIRRADVQTIPPCEWDFGEQDLEEVMVQQVWRVPVFCAVYVPATRMVACSVLEQLSLAMQHPIVRDELGDAGFSLAGVGDITTVIGGGGEGSPLSTADLQLTVNSTLRLSRPLTQYVDIVVSSVDVE